MNYKDGVTSINFSSDELDYLNTQKLGKDGSKTASDQNNNNHNIITKSDPKHFSSAQNSSPSSVSVSQRQDQKRNSGSERSQRLSSNSEQDSEDEDDKFSDFFSDNESLQAVPLLTKAKPTTTKPTPSVTAQTNKKAADAASSSVHSKTSSRDVMDFESQQKASASGWKNWLSRFKSILFQEQKMSPQESLSLTWLEKWRKYRRFPWKFLLHIVITGLCTALVTKK